MNAKLTATSDIVFLAKLSSWIERTGEILVLTRYSHSGGLKDFEFFTSYPKIAIRTRKLPPLTSVIAFRKPQLPLRGVVTDKFIAQCLAEIPNGREYLVVELAQRTYGSFSWFHFDPGESHDELREGLEYSRDVRVAVGLYPDWLYDNDDVASAIVPDASGSVKGGAY